MEDGKYLNLWKKYLPVIKILLKKSIYDAQRLPLSKVEFESAGDRKLSGYSFNLEIEKGKVINDISGTAVARDLFKVLNEDVRIMELLSNGRTKISLGKSFELVISKKDTLIK